MTFVIVVIVLGLFLGFGVAMGVLIVSAFSRRRAYQYLEQDAPWEQPQMPPEYDERPSWPGG